MKINSLLSLIFLTHLFSCTSLYSAQFVNRGTFNCEHANIDHGNFTNDGTVRGRETVNIKAKVFDGSGSVEGKKILLACDEFKYSGNISCDQECVILAKKPFDQNMFKRTGSGKFTIIEGEENFQKYMEEKEARENRQ